MSGLYETTEETMVAAHKAGVTYWEKNKPIEATRENLASLARSRHWHDQDCHAWLAGFYGAKRRWEAQATATATLTFSARDLTLLRCGLIERLDKLAGRPECEASYTRSKELLQILWNSRLEVDNNV